MQYPVKCLKINFKEPLMICRVVNTPKIALEKPEEIKEEESEYKRSFSARLLEAMGNMAKGKKSIKEIQKPRKRRRRRRKKND